MEGEGRKGNRERKGERKGRKGKGKGKEKEKKRKRKDTSGGSWSAYFSASWYCELVLVICCS